VVGYSPGPCILHDSATTTCSKSLITYITVTVPPADVRNSTAFRKGVGGRSDSVECLLVPYVFHLGAYVTFTMPFTFSDAEYADMI